MGKRVLIVDAGGRGHAIAWKLAQSPQVAKIFVATGNAGTAEIAENVPVDITHVKKLVRFAENKNIDLIVPCSEETVAAGIADECRVRGIYCFAPCQSAALLESSKAYAKGFMVRAGIPTAAFRAFKRHDAALACLKTRAAPIVIKASGLAAGKGVYVCPDMERAEEALKLIMIEKVHGAKAGKEVVIEEYLDGPELSVLVFCDGKSYKIMPPVQDHKYALDGNKGKMTGGMGTYARVPWADAALMKNIEKLIIKPAVESIYSAGHHYVGCLFFGLKITREGPKLLEINVRFGDPEAQALMLLLLTDLWKIFDACVRGKLRRLKIEWSDDFAVCLALASGGYPGEYRAGYPVYGLDELRNFPDIIIFHAGTGYGKNPWLVTRGGRVLYITGKGPVLPDVIRRVYEAEKIIWFKDKFCRHDIGAQSE